MTSSIESYGQGSRIVFGLTMEVTRAFYLEGEFWRADTVAADGTKLVAHARTPARAAAFLYLAVADHLVARGASIPVEPPEPCEHGTPEGKDCEGCEHERYSDGISDRERL